jgi:hypothetical protein
MQTGWSIIIGAVLISGVGAATAFALQPRYSLGNPGQGITIRLDRKTGDLLGCERLVCRLIVSGDTIAEAPIPAPPAGYRIIPSTR